MFGLELWQIALAGGVTLFAGFVKGAVGFAMPMIMMSAFGSFLPAETALALLIVPTLVTNLAQASRQGWGAAWDSMITYRRHIVAVVVFLILAAPLVKVIPPALLYGLLGAPIVAFALWQLAGKSMKLRVEHRNRVEIGLGVVGGLYGGISGIWGPPLIVFLLSVGAGKEETVRVQGVVFMIGSVALLFAHMGSGVLNGDTLPLSAMNTLPAMIGLWTGFRLHDRLDAARFRRWTLVLLTVTGLNLLRRAFDT